MDCLHPNFLNFTAPSRVGALFLEHNWLSRLENDTFESSEPWSSLTFINLGFNELTTIQSGTFSPLHALRQLALSYNRLTLIESGGFDGLDELEALFLNNNQLQLVPAAIRSVTSALEITLAVNNLTRIESGDFDGLTNLFRLAVDRNPIAYLDSTAFKALTNLSVPLDDFADRSSVMGFTISSEAARVGGGESRNFSLPPLVMSPSRRDCKWVGPDINDVDCSRCAFGYLLDQATSKCEDPVFGTWEGWTTGTTSASLNTRVRWESLAPDLEPKSDRFVGYSKRDYTAIAYQIDFETEVDLGCGEVYRNDTSFTAPTRLPDGHVWDATVRGAFFKYNERPQYIRVEVVTAGMFTFSSCYSDEAVSLGLYDRNVTELEAGQHPTSFVYTDIMSPIEGEVWQTNYPWLGNMAGTPQLWSSGCDLSYSANRTVHLEPGAYWLAVRASPYFDDMHGGTYKVQMGCGGGGAAKSASGEDPGGLSVHPNTGVISGTPTRTGQLVMRLLARDGAGLTTQISKWNLTITEPLFRTVENWDATVLDAAAANRRIVDKYELGDLHEVLGPDLDKTALFLEPNDNNFDEIFFALFVNGNGTSCPDNIRVHTEIQTGAGTFRVPCAGNFTATLKARDIGGEEAIVNKWSFEMRQKDTNVSTYGPGSRDCVHGRRVDGVKMDEAFTCDCSETAFQGANCQTTTSAASQSEGQGEYTLALVLPSLLLLLIVMTFVMIYRRNQRIRRNKSLDFTSIVHEAPTHASEQGSEPIIPMELPRSKIVLFEELGHGQFGTVSRGTLDERHSHYFAHIGVGGPNRRASTKHTVVAVKSLKSDAPAAVEDFQREAIITAQFSHSNVVRMFGVVTRGQPFLLVLEFCANGALDSYLKSSALKKARELTEILFDVSNGMAYLACRGFCHRDLAARNVLIDADDTARVADFGLSRDLEDTEYYQMSDAGGVLPLRWCAPEVFGHQKFGEASDVFAFGITCHEVFSKAQTPYRGWTNLYVVERVQGGFRMPRPEACPEELYSNVVSRCLKEDVKDRPRFQEISALIQSTLNYYAASVAYANADGTEEEHQQTAITGTAFLPPNNALLVQPAATVSVNYDTDYQPAAPAYENYPADKDKGQVVRRNQVGPMASGC